MEIQQNSTDLIIVVDATGSMSSFLSSLTESLKQFIKIIDITNVVKRVSITMYRDYCDKIVVKSSDWVTKIDDLMPFILDLKADGGGDIPEAAKTAANDVLDRAENNTIVVWYADAPPHHKINSRNNSSYQSNFHKERDALTSKNKIFDWIDICKKFVEKRIVVYPVINQREFNIASYYVMMSTITGGKTIYLENTNHKLITQTTIKLFLNLMGCDNEFKSGVKELSYSTNINHKLLVDENQCDNYLPSDSRPLKTIKEDNLVVDSHSWLVTNLRKLAELFNTDIAYKNKIYGVFESLLNPQSVLALTYNTVFATFWRLICKNYDDDRKDILKAKLTETLEQLKKNNREDHAIVTEWISDSYNQTYEINEIIKTKAPHKVPALVLDTARYYLPQEILELSRSCNAKVLALVVDMMSSLRVVDREEDLPKTSDDEINHKGQPIPIKYIPLSLSNRYLFNILPHLVAPGSNFSLRPSLIMATVAYITNNVILKKRAQEHLEFHKGKWMDQDLPENYTGGFANLMLRVPEFLTEEEIQFLKLNQRIFGLLINGDTELNVELPFTPFKRVCDDYKIRCDYCQNMRSFTLTTIDLDGKYKCGLCHSGPEYMAPESCDDEHSVYLECKSCQSHYALINVHLMNVTPKCYGCRHADPQPTVKCSLCQNKFVDPSKIYGETFVCPQCRTDPRSAIDELKVAFKNLYQQNTEIVSQYAGFQMPSDINVFGGHSVFTIKDKIKILENLTETLPRISMISGKKPILNAGDVLAEMLKWINSGVAEKSFCMICFNEFTKSNLRKVCGRRACCSVACHDCLKSWYGENKVGDLIQVNSLTCPFCKQCPTTNILSSYNRQVCAMIRKNDSFDINWWYGWCQECFEPKKVVEKECSADAPNLAGKFTCDDCRNMVVGPEDSKQCPGCQIAIIKNGGCNHMECAACKKHFCWICADTASNNSQEVYDHLYKIHGGAFGTDEVPELDDEIPELEVD